MYHYVENEAILLESLIDLYESVEWTAYTRSTEKMSRIIQQSLWHLAVYDDDRLVGLIRAIGDDVSIVYIQDILMHPSYQRQGIGRDVMMRVLKRFEHVRQIVLITDDTPKSVAFYESVGMIAIPETGGQCFIKYNLDT